MDHSLPGSSVHGILQARMLAAAAAAKSLESCLTLCNPIDGSPPGSPVPGILQERTLEWVAISFSNAWKWKVKVKLLSHVWLFMTPWTAAYQAPCPWDFPGKRNGVCYHCLRQGIFQTQGSNPGFPHCRQILYCLSHQGSPCIYINTDKYNNYILCVCVCIKISVTKIWPHMSCGS